MYWEEGENPTWELIYSAYCRIIFYGAAYTSVQYGVLGQLLQVKYEFYSSTHILCDGNAAYLPFVLV